MSATPTPENPTPENPTPETSPVATRSATTRSATTRSATTRAPASTSAPTRRRLGERPAERATGDETPPRAAAAPAEAQSRPVAEGMADIPPGADDRHADDKRTKKDAKKAARDEARRRHETQIEIIRDGVRPL